MKLSNQAMGAIMMALQESIMEQKDITETLRSFDFLITGSAQDELVISNPPVLQFPKEDA
tara:strand:- start:814 stop:993 length:180 start_codon:yes stop_codon:yes gene_type:complete